MMDDTPAAATDLARRKPRWRGAAVVAGSLAVAAAGLFASTELHGIPALRAVSLVARPAVNGATIQLADDAVPLTTRTPSAGSPFVGAFKGSPEARLIGIYHLIGAQQMDLAIEAASSLTRDVPGFRLAQLLYADLLSTRMGTAPRIGAHGFGAQATEVEELRDEAQARLKALQERPPADQVPEEFILLPKAVHHAIAVDTSRSRLYLFENGPRGMRLVSDHYVSMGKNGVDKSVEGDQRTPLGVYFVSDRVGREALEERFGAGAMALNYPNAFDKLRGRTGSGIYLHGVPFSTYSRPPKDSDGCVVLANDELQMLMNTVPLHDTPVIITRKLHWASDVTSHVDEAQILDAVNHWQSVRSAADTTTLASFYQAGAAPAFPPASDPASASPQPSGRAAARREVTPVHESIAFTDLSVLTWSDEKETMVVTFHERFARRENVLRQYWERDSSQWKIVAEGIVR